MIPKLAPLVFHFDTDSARFTGVGVGLEGCKKGVTNDHVKIAAPIWDWDCSPSFKYPGQVVIVAHMEA